MIAFLVLAVICSGIFLAKFGQVLGLDVKGDVRELREALRRRKGK